LSTELTKLRCF